jgi:hypothetical protein
MPFDGGVHFVAIDNNDVNEEVPFNRGYTSGAQRRWVERELAAARADPDVDFIVVLMHQCAFSSSSKHGSDPGVYVAWAELFARYSVDLVFQGHDHVYERSHAMRLDRITDHDMPYATDVGTVYVTCDNGGALQEPFKPMQPAWSAFRQAFKVGTVRVEVDPFAPGGRRRLTLSEYWARGGAPIEEGIVLERLAQRGPVPAPAGAREDSAQPRTEATSSAAPAPEAEAALPLTGGSGVATLVGAGAAATAAATAGLLRLYADRKRGPTRPSRARS